MAALFGARMRELRTAAGPTQAELGAKTHVVGTRITRIERASGAKPTLELARALDAVLGADNLLVDLWPYVYREAFPDWSRKFMAYSERAVSIRQYAAHVVPGPLQTEDYARAVLSGDLRRARDGQVPIKEVVSDHLRYLTWAPGDDFPSSLRLRQYPASVPVVIDPGFGHGLPVVAANRVPVKAITDPWEAGESVEDIAYDYGMTPEQVDALCQAVVRLAA